MNFVSELFVNAQATQMLQRKYYWLTSFVGLMAVAVGMGIMFLCSLVLGSALGIDPNEPIHAHPNGKLLMALLLASIPVSLYVGMVSVAWPSSLAMVRLGLMQREEALPYALRSRYPQSWFKQGSSDGQTRAA